MNLLRLLSGTTWGGTKSCLLTIYRMMIRPIIEYCFEAYLCSSKYVVNKLQKIQNIALRICCGAMRSTPVFALQHCCNEYPLHLRHLQACLLYKNYLLSAESHPCRSLITQSWHEIFPDSSTFRTFSMITSAEFYNNCQHEKNTLTKDPPWLLPPISIDLSLTSITGLHPSEVRNRSLELITKDYPHHVKIFTDGSKSESGCWCAFTVDKSNISESITITRNCSIFSAELYAIFKSLEWLKRALLNKL